MKSIKTKKDLTGLRVGKLLVLERGEDYYPPGDKYGEARWICQCDCGKQTLVLGYRLRKGLTQSCGCLIAENNKKYKHNYKGFNHYEIRGDDLFIFFKDQTSTIVDVADFLIVSKYHWHKHHGYAEAAYKENGVIKHITLHALLLERKFIDHIDGNPLNNRRNNLRPYNDLSLNASNSVKRKVNTSGYIGVKLHKGRYEANVDFHGKRYYCGSFVTPKEAAMARDQKAKELMGEFAKLNFSSKEEKQ